MAARSIWSFQDHFDFRLDVGPNSPFHHALEQHRGEYSRQKMLTTFHLDPLGQLRPGAKPKQSEAVLFGGHVGCGKSTELRDYAGLFRTAYTVHLLELTKTLDIHNLRFSDLLIALAQALVNTFEDAQLSLCPDPVFLKPVLDWFDTRIVKQERFKDIEGEIRTEAKAQGGIPWLASLLATMTAKVRGGASYREELRRESRQAVRDVAADYQRLVRQSDWFDLVRIDRSLGDEKDRTDERLRLLYDLVLLEYNNYWWRSHPLVRCLAPYAKARAAAGQG